MTKPTEDTQVWSPEHEVGRAVEEEDQSGAPEKVAWPLADDEERLAPAEQDDERLASLVIALTGTHLT